MGPGFLFPRIALPFHDRLCISFDTTGSMYPCIGEVKRKVAELVGRLLHDIPHMKIALVAHGDYGDVGTAYLMKQPVVLLQSTFLN